MVVVMEKGASQEAVERVLDEIKSLGFTPHISTGEKRARSSGLSGLRRRRTCASIWRHSLMSRTSSPSPNLSSWRAASFGTTIRR